MPKIIFKEIFIVLLATVAIGLVLAVIFYQYVPSNRMIPTKVTAYKASEEVQKEINDQAQEEQLQSETKVYEVTDSDLAMYKRTQSYNPGKADPFAPASSSPTGSENESTGNSVGTGNQEEPVDRNTTDNFYTSAGVNSGTK